MKIKNFIKMGVLGGLSMIPSISNTTPVPHEFISLQAYLQQNPEMASFINVAIGVFIGRGIINMISSGYRLLKEDKPQTSFEKIEPKIDSQDSGRISITQSFTIMYNKNGSLHCTFSQKSPKFK